MIEYQAFIYEMTADLGPHWSALLAGFAVIIFGDFHITPAGELYLERHNGGD